MGVFVFRRLWRTLLVLIGISVVVFAFVRALPGDPATAILGERANPESVARLTKQLGLDKPWFLNLSEPRNLLDAQYPKYLSKVLRGDLDKGQKSQMSLAAMFFALIVGLPAGIVAALRRNSVWDSLATTISLVGVSMPVFWLGLLLSYYFAVVLGWFPPSSRLSVGVDIQPVTGMYLLDSLLRGRLDVSWDALRHLVLPAITLGSIPMAITARITRSSLLEVLDQDYVRTAKAKGLAPRLVTLKHAMRNAMLPVVTVVGLQAGLLLGGAVLTETIFSWPGLGSWLYDAISGLVACRQGPEHLIPARYPGRPYKPRA